MSRRANEKVHESEEDLEALAYAKKELEAELHEKLQDITTKWSELVQAVTKKEITPRRTDVKVTDPVIVWYPYWKSGRGERESAMG